MAGSPNKNNIELITSRAHGTMLDHTSSKVFVGDLPPVISDEKPSGSGRNLGPSLLENIGVR